MKGEVRVRKATPGDQTAVMPRRSYYIQVIESIYDSNSRWVVVSAGAGGAPTYVSQLVCCKTEWQCTLSRWQTGYQVEPCAPLRRLARMLQPVKIGVRICPCPITMSKRLVCSLGAYLVVKKCRVSLVIRMCGLGADGVLPRL